MAEQLLHAPEVGAPLEQMRGERVPQEVGMDALRLQTRLPGQPSQDQEGARPCQRPSLRIQEQLGPVAAFEVRASVSEIAAQRVRAGAADGNDALTVALAERSHEAPLEVDPSALEPDSLADTQAGAVEKLRERPVAQGARRRPRCRGESVRGS